MPYKDIEKKRASDRKYAQSEKGGARTKRYLESHKTELAKKREEQREKRLEAFCRWHNADPWSLKRLIAMREAGRDIEEYDPHNAKFLHLFERGLRKEKKGKEASVASSDYF